jgi:hypothetical protein
LDLFKVHRPVDISLDRWQKRESREVLETPTRLLFNDMFEMP